MTGSTGSPPHSVEEDLYLPMIPGVPSQPSSKSPSKEPSLEDVVPVMGHDPQDFSDRDSYIHMQDSTEDPPVPLDDDLPSIDLPSPIPLSPRDIEPGELNWCPNTLLRGQSTHMSVFQGSTFC